MPARAKLFEHTASVDRAGRISAENGGPLALHDAWSPEHLLLAALCRCTLKSLAYHARRANLDVVGSASARDVVTRREEDGRYAIVELSCSLDVEVDPEPPGEELEALLAKAQRDCFVSASLAVPTEYRWRVNGRDVG